jgi:hypothetical protein
MWQFTHVRGLSDKYEGAFDTFNVNNNNPVNTASVKITGSFHRFGGKRNLIIQ